MRTILILGLFGAFVGLIILFPHSMLEPGELAEAHQRTGNDCFACHQPFGGLPNDKCIGCHPVGDIGNDGMPNQRTTPFHEVLGALSCVDCHSDHMGRDADLTQGGFEHTLVPASTLADCNRCHAKPTDELHKGLPNACTSCHDTEGWKPARDFDHSLLSADGRAACATCHQPPTDALHARMKGNCATCHATDAWKPATFDHSLLTGSEMNNCATCHQAPEDGIHQGNKQNCASCHGMNAWSPSTFDHARYFLLDGDHNATCATCHKNKKYDTYTCYGCHEHTPGNILGEHQEEGITNITDCVRCHRSGDEDDIRDGGERGGSDQGRKKGKDDDD